MTTLPAQTAPEGNEWVLGDDGDVAIHDPESGSALDYRSLRERVEVIAHQLAGLGVGEGDAVAYSLPNGPESIVVFLAVAASGAAAAPLNPIYGADEVSRYLVDLKPRVVIVHGETIAATRDASRASGVRVAVLSGTGEHLQLADAPSGEPTTPTPEQVVLLLHTSGTTGRAKVVPLRRRNLTASVRAVAHHYSLTRADVSHCVMPLFHVHGIVASTLAPLSTGGSVIAPRRFSAGAFWGTAPPSARRGSRQCRQSIRSCSSGRRARRQSGTGFASRARPLPLSPPRC